MSNPLPNSLLNGHGGTALWQFHRCVAPTHTSDNLLWPGMMVTAALTNNLLCQLQLTGRYCVACKLALQPAVQLTLSAAAIDAGMYVFLWSCSCVLLTLIQFKSVWTGQPDLDGPLHMPTCIQYVQRLALCAKRLAAGSSPSTGCPYTYRLALCARHAELLAVGNSQQVTCGVCGWCICLCAW